MINIIESPDKSQIGQLEIDIVEKIMEKKKKFISNFVIFFVSYFQGIVLNSLLYLYSNC